MADEFHQPSRWTDLGRQHPGLKPLLDAIGVYLEDRDRELEAWLANFARNAVSITNITEEVWTPAAHHLSHEPGGADEVDGLPGLVWRGAYSAVTEYHLRDAVQSGGTAYYCIATTSLGSAPPSANWSLLASKGDTGDPGDPMEAAMLAPVVRGPKGDAGSTGPAADPLEVAMLAPVARGRDGTNGTNGTNGVDADEGLLWADGGAVDWTARESSRLLGVTVAAMNPGHFIQDESAAVLAQRATLSFQGEGVTASDSGTRTIVTVPGGADEGLTWMTGGDSDLEARTRLTRAEATLAALAATDAAGDDASDALHWTQVGP